MRLTLPAAEDLLLHFTSGQIATCVLGKLITGAGFLGAGVMMTHDGIVTGATFDATVWMMVATGAMIGLDLLP